MAKHMYLATALLTLGFAGSVSAAPVASSFATSDGTSFNAAALTGFMTTGDDMAGTLVTVTFSNGFSPTQPWVTTGVNSGGAFAPGNAWSLVLSGDSFSNPWTLQNNTQLSIVSFSIDGVPGSTTFDIIDTPVQSPGSANGNAFGNVDAPASVTSADATYTNRLLVGGVFYDDEYTRLDVNLVGGLAAGGTLTFIADADNADSRGIIQVPEPASLALLGGAVVAGAMVRRRRG